MYTKLNQEDVIQGFSKWIARVWGFVVNDMKRNEVANPTDVYLIVDEKEKYVSHTFSTNKAEGLSQNDLIQMTECYIKNAYFANGNFLKRQSAGLAIGGHPSMQIANLFCAGIEWEHSEELIQKISGDEIQKRFVYTEMKGLALVFGYVDDRLSRRAATISFLRGKTSKWKSVQRKKVHQHHYVERARNRSGDG